MSDPYDGLPPAPPVSPQYGQAVGSDPYRGRPQRGPRPDTVTNAVRAMYSLVLVNLLGVLVLFATKDDLRKKIRDNTPNASNSTVDSAVTVALVVALVFIVLYGLLAFQVSRGRQWARVVTWVLAGLGIISGLVNLGQPEPALTRVLGVVGLVLEIGIVVLLCLRRSNGFFRP